jgi:hypothetical protein
MNLIEGLAQEIKRVTGVRQHYLEVGPAGALAAAMMQAELDNAVIIMGSGDVLQMMRVYESLKGFQD